MLPSKFSIKKKFRIPADRRRFYRRKKVISNRIKLTRDREAMKQLLVKMDIIEEKSLSPLRKIDTVKNPYMLNRIM